MVELAAKAELKEGRLSNAFNDVYNFVCGRPWLRTRRLIHCISFVDKANKVVFRGVLGEMVREDGDRDA